MIINNNFLFISPCFFKVGREWDEVAIRGEGGGSGINLACQQSTATVLFVIHAVWDKIVLAYNLEGPKVNLAFENKNIALNIVNVLSIISENSISEFITLSSVPLSKTITVKLKT